MNPLMLLGIINGVIDIVSRHQATGATKPLTAEQIHGQLVADLQDGQSKIAREFAAKGWELPA